MTSEPSIDRILSKVLGLASHRRSAFLDQACGSDADLRTEVQHFIAALERNPDFLASPTAEVPPTADPRGNSVTRSACDPRVASEIPNESRIGAYRLLERIGEGGFGTVYMAEQSEPVQRRVALKVIKPGMDSRQVIARFEAERQALALMDHPSIARVFDAGATDAQSPLGAGRPYFVMELVKGVPITAYCDTHALGIRERLELFIAVCQAVQHAHQKGIIHRDVKPSNVLVTLYDGQAVPKVIDFGIAKALHQKLTDKTLFTEFRQLLGTPEYMSPEQAELSAIDIDTRSDVYSLGVLLYELLTGTTPFEGRVLQHAGYDEMRRMIREVEPPRPSTRFSSLQMAGSTAPARNKRASAVAAPNSSSPAAIAGARHSDPKSLARLLRGDLDWIVMKCLEKDRARRYETANSLALDVQRHLAGEPVVAAPPSKFYRARKVLRRHRAAAAILLAFVLTAGAGLLTALALWQQAEVARDAESDQRARAESINLFLKEMLTAADPAKSMGAKLTVRAALDEAAERIDDGALDEQPAVAAELHATIGQTYFALGLFPQAKLHLTAAEEIQARVLGDDHPEVLHTRSQLARCYAWEGEGDRAVKLARPTLEKQRRVLGEDHPETLRTLSFLGNGLLLCMELEESEACLRQALAGQHRRLGRENEDTIETMFYLSWSIGPFSVEAIDIAREALDIAQRALGPDHPHTSYASLFLGMACRYNNRNAEAVSHLRRALDETRRVFGEEHVRTADCLAELGTTLEHLGRVEEGIDLLRQSADIARRTYGPGKKWTLRYQETLGFLLNESTRWAEAAEVLSDALSQSRRARGDEDFETLNILCNYSTSLQHLDRLEEAAACAAEAYETACRVNGAHIVTTRDFGRRYAAVLWKLGRRDDSLAVIGNTLAVTRSAFGSGHPQMVNELYRSAWFLHERGCYAEAEPFAREAVEGYRVMDAKLTSMGSPQDILARILDRLNRPRESLELALEAARAAEANAQHLDLAAHFLLTTPIEELRDPLQALEFALKATEISGYKNPSHLDTLALASHQTGDTAMAITLQRMAIALLPPDAPDREQYETQLCEFERALESGPPDGPARPVRRAVPVLRSDVRASVSQKSI